MATGLSSLPLVQAKVTVNYRVTAATSTERPGWIPRLLRPLSILLFRICNSGPTVLNVTISTEGFGVTFWSADVQAEVGQTVRHTLNQIAPLRSGESPVPSLN